MDLGYEFICIFLFRCHTHSYFYYYCIIYRVISSHSGMEERKKTFFANRNNLINLNNSEFEFYDKTISLKNHTFATLTQIVTVVDIYLFFLFLLFFIKRSNNTCVDNKSEKKIVQHFLS